MDISNFPRITPERIKGVSGQVFFQNYVITKWGWLFHKIDQENDYGIDAFIEIVNNGYVTGKKIAVQIKYGNSYLKNERNNRILFYGENKHLNYYQNSNVPVIIVLINDNFSKIYWELFDMEKIIPTDEGWNMEIICRDINKEDIEKIAGPIIDYTEEIKMHNSIHKLIVSSDYYLLVIPKDDIENLDYSIIIDHINYLSKSSRVLEKKYQSMDICIFGYDDNSRELFEIPEVINWFKRSVDINIPWLYFLSTFDNNAGYTLLFLSSLFERKSQKVCRGYNLLFEGKDISNFLLVNYPILNSFMEKHELSIELNEKICKNIHNKFEKQFKEI